MLDVPAWPGHRAGHHVDVRLTAEDGYQASRSYSIASAPEHDAVERTIERFDDGEVSPYLVDDVIAGDQFEVPGDRRAVHVVGRRGQPALPDRRRRDGPAVGDAAPPRGAPRAQITAHMLVSNRSATAGIYTTELETLTPREQLHVAWTYTRQVPDGWRGWTRCVDDAQPAPERTPMGTDRGAGRLASQDASHGLQRGAEHRVRGRFPGDRGRRQLPRRPLYSERGEERAVGTRVDR